MNATTWLIIAIVGFSLSGIALIAAIFIFIKLNIPAVVGDLTGKTAAREVQAIRAANESGNHNTGNTENPDNGNEDNVRKSAMALAHLSKRLDKTADMRTTGEMSGKESETHKSNSVETRETEAFMPAGFTEPLMENPKTSVLSGNDEIQEYATTAFSATAELVERKIIPVNFTVTRSIILVHTNEVI